MNDPELEKLAEVVDQRTFVAFIRALADERIAVERKGGHGDWEHGTIGTYLDAVAARGEDADYDFDDVSKADNPWRRAACILLYGKYYQ